MPLKQLRGFEKVGLQAGESKHITLTLSPEELYVYNEATASYQVPEGEYTVQVGGSSDSLPLKTIFTLAGAEGKADLSVKNIRTLPAFPKEGDKVVFMASLINNGTAPTKVGEDHTLRFYVNGKEVASYHCNSVAIPVGGMELACAQGLKGINWTALKGDYKIIAKVEVTGSRDLNLLNNQCEAVLTIPNGKAIPVEVAKVIQ
jgi:beta-glucosidase